MDTIVSSPRTTAWRRWLPVVLSIGSGLWLFGAAGLFIAAEGPLTSCSSHRSPQRQELRSS
jgi:hypothetical protein